MKYMILLYGPETDPSGTEEDRAAQMQAEMQPWYDFDAAVREAGILVDSAALEPSSTGTSVRVRNAETLLTDGPFAETKEVLGGYYVIDVADLDEAVAWASRAPSALDGVNEVRPVMEIPPA